MSHHLEMIHQLALVILSLAVGLAVGQQNGPPKILAIASADSYPEGSTINLVCTVSGGQRKGLRQSWYLGELELNEQTLRLNPSKGLENISIDGDDDGVSILKIRNAGQANSGAYTCTAENSIGRDSTTVNVVVDVEMKWKKIPSDVEVAVNQDVTIECEAQGFPEPKIDWFRHGRGQKGSNGTVHLVSGKWLKISRVQLDHSGLYECIAHNKVHPDLRRVVHVHVKGSTTTGTNAHG